MYLDMYVYVCMYLLSTLTTNHPQQYRLLSGTYLRKSAQESPPTHSTNYSLQGLQRRPDLLNLRLPRLFALSTHLAVWGAFIPPRRRRRRIMRKQFLRHFAGLILCEHDPNIPLGHLMPHQTCSQTPSASSRPTRPCPSMAQRQSGHRLPDLPRVRAATPAQAAASTR